MAQITCRVTAIGPGGSVVAVSGPVTVLEPIAEWQLVPGEGSLTVISAPDVDPPVPTGGENTITISS